MAYTVSLQLLERGRVSVASQLLALLANVLIEVGIESDGTWVTRMETIDTTYIGALETMRVAQPDEYERLMRLHYQYLKKIVKWSADFGRIKFGDLKLHNILGEQCWKLSSTMQHYDDDDNAPNDEDYIDFGMEGMRAEGIMHLALAEEPQRIGELLKTLPKPTAAQEKMGRDGGPAAERDCLLTRSILVFAAMENLRDANVLIRLFIDEIDTDRELKKLSKSYMNKNDGLAPTHVMFCCMLLRVCEKDRAGPLFQWLLRSFSSDVGKMRPDVKGYTTKIGRVYFGIQPPPDMLSMMENMMGMMAGGGMGGMMAPGMM